MSAQQMGDAQHARYQRELSERVSHCRQPGSVTGGFLLKDCTPPSLVSAVGSVVAGETMLAPRLTKRLLDHFVARNPVVSPEISRLSERELEVTRLFTRLGVRDWVDIAER